MRVYLAATLPALRALVAERRLVAPLAGAAVTPALPESYAVVDAEELEYAALTAAAGASLRLLADDPMAPRRRVVVAADVPDVAVRPVADRDPAAVEVTADVPLARVASVHVDEPTAAPLVAAAIAALPAADAGDPDAIATVEDVDAVELQWWATQELPDLLDG